MDPNVQEAQDKLQQAEQIENTAAEIRSDNTSSGESATELETTAANLRSEAEQEQADAQAAAEQEKQEVDQKYGTG